MKLLLTISFLLITFLSFSQKDTCSCLKGYSCFPFMSTSSLVIQEVHCATDSLVKKLWKVLEENLCGEGGLYISDNKTSYSHISNWVKDSGCMVADIYKKKINNSWIKITKQEYEKLNANILTSGIEKLK